MSESVDTAVEEEVIEAMEQSAEVYGLSRSAGRVYGVLYFAEEPLTIPELVDETGYAKSTISNVTRKLDRIGLIYRRSSEGGGRKVAFEPEAELWYVLQDVLQQYLHREIGATQRTLQRAMDRLASADGDTATEERVGRLLESYGEIERLLEKTLDHSVGELVEAIERYES